MSTSAPGTAFLPLCGGKAADEAAKEVKNEANSSSYPNCVLALGQQGWPES